MLKKILIASVVLIGVLVVAIGAVVILAPAEYRVEREVTINKPRDEVFNYVKILKNQNDWGPWFKKDPAMKLGSRGTDGSVGYVQTWDSQNDQVGAGEQELKKIVDGERIESELRFLRPFESKSDAYITTEDAGPGQTKVKWGFSGSMPRPMNALLLVIDMDAEVGKDFQEGLQNLKVILEKS